MKLALSSRWNAIRHDDGELLAAEIASLGFTRIELGYDTRTELVPGVKRAIQGGVLQCNSVHNFCPVPPGVLRGHPELFSLASLDKGEREQAVYHTRQTIRLAAELGAATVVTHAGNVIMRPVTSKLMDLCRRDKQDSARHAKRKFRLMEKRGKHAPAHLDRLYASMDALIPSLQQYGITLALENLPAWESIPTAAEMEAILERYVQAPIAYWHDTGHAQIMDNLGIAPHFFTLRKLAPRLAGMHIHDVKPPCFDHIMPPAGQIRFEMLAEFVKTTDSLVLEPAPQTPSEMLRTAAAFLNDTWSLT